MKKPQRKRPRQRRKKETLELRGLFRQPDPQFYRLPELELRGGRVMTDGCRRVLDFTPTLICLDMGDTVITFYGERLQIESLAGKRLIVTGRVVRIDFASKWEGSDAPL